MRTRILLVDDHAILRECLHVMLERTTEYQVIAEAAEGQAAIRLAQDLSPDVIIMDISMPGINGIEATKAIVASNEKAKIICMSASLDKHHVLSMLKAGAVGYVPKVCLFNELIMAIRSVLNGQVYLSPYVASFVVENYLQPKQVGIDALTTREQEIFHLLVDGGSIKEIAQRLFISEKTVNTHRQHIMERLGVHNLADLIKYAISTGVIDLGNWRQERKYE